MAIGRALPAIVETGAALARGHDFDEILVEVLWLSGLAGRVAFAGTLRQISEERLQAPATYRAFPVRSVMMNATRAFAVLSARASRAGIEIDWAM